MNNTFDIQRFSLLLKRKWLEFGKIYLITLAVSLGIMLISYTIAFWSIITNLETFSDNTLDFREPLFFCFGFLFITVVASTYFSHLGHKPKTITDLLIPASTFEKFMAGIFFTGIMTTVSFVVLFFLTDLVFVSKFRIAVPGETGLNSFRDAEGAVTAITNKGVYFFAPDRLNIFMPLYLVPFFVTSIFLLGSIWFNKYHYIKTTLSVMVFAGIWTAIVFKTGEILTEGRRAVNHSRPIYHAANDTMEWIITLLLLMVTVVIWTITYFRLKEKEV